MEEQAYSNINKTKESSLYQHLLSCEHDNQLVYLFRLLNKRCSIYNKYKIIQQLLMEQITGTFCYFRNRS